VGVLDRTRGRPRPDFRFLPLGVRERAAAVETGSLSFDRDSLTLLRGEGGDVGPCPGARGGATSLGLADSFFGVGIAGSETDFVTFGGAGGGVGSGKDAVSAGDFSFVAFFGGGWVFFSFPFDFFFFFLPFLSPFFTWFAHGGGGGDWVGSSGVGPGFGTGSSDLEGDGTSLGASEFGVAFGLASALGSGLVSGWTDPLVDRLPFGSAGLALGTDASGFGLTVGFLDSTVGFFDLTFGFTFGLIF